MKTNELPADILALLEETEDLEQSTNALKETPTDFNSPDFVSDYLKAVFVNDVIGAMKQKKLNKNELAKKVGCSKQYIGRILNETTNYTLETIAKFACALDKEVVFSLRDKPVKTAVEENKVYDEDQKEVSVIEYNDETKKNYLIPILFNNLLKTKHN